MAASDCRHCNSDGVDGDLELLAAWDQHTRSPDGDAVETGRNRLDRNLPAATDA